MRTLSLRVLRTKFGEDFRFGVNVLFLFLNIYFLCICTAQAQGAYSIYVLLHLELPTRLQESTNLVPVSRRQILKLSGADLAKLEAINKAGYLLASHS